MVEDINNKYNIFLYELVDFPETNYFVINDMDLINIFKQLKGSNLSKFNLVRYFVACRRVSNNDSNFGFLSQTKLKRLVRDSKTIQNYNKLLQDDLHLIRYNNNYRTSDKNYYTTFIGHYDDEKNFNEQVRIEAGSNGLILTDKKKSNKKRSVQQKINKNSEKLSIEELEELLKQKKELEYKPKTKDKSQEPKVKHLGNSRPEPYIKKTEEDIWGENIDIEEYELNIPEDYSEEDEAWCRTNEEQMISEMSDEERDDYFRRSYEN